MTKIKTFQFLLSNFAGNDVYHYDSCGYKPKKNPETERDIDRKVNKWIEKNNAIVKDIKTTTYTLNRHNNGMDDTVIMVYTIIYEAVEEKTEEA